MDEMDKKKAPSDLEGPEIIVSRPKPTPSAPADRAPTPAAPAKGAQTPAAPAKGAQPPSAPAGRAPARRAPSRPSAARAPSAPSRPSAARAPSAPSRPSAPSSAPAAPVAPAPKRTGATPSATARPTAARRSVPSRAKTPAVAPAPVLPQTPAPQTPAPQESPAPAAKARRERPASTTDRAGMLASVLKALLYIALVLIVSGFLAVFGIRFANDVFAFVKDEITVEVTVPAGATLAEVSEILESHGLVEEADWFELYTGFKYRDREGGVNFVGGTYTLRSTMNYNSLIAALTPRAGREIVSVLIPEGYTVDQIIDLLVERGIGSREGYVDAIQNYPYSYEFLDKLDAIELSDARKYRLEGYLFPAKYDLYKDASEVAVIDKFLAAFQANVNEDIYDRCLELDMNIDEVITLASIIQDEAHFSSDMYYISGVLHNRLNNAASFPYLGCDATVQYALPEHKEQLSKEDLAVDSPYNTHLYKGLPPGAISNPGMDAITAALYPEDKLMESRGVKSYYFVAGVDGYSLFGANEREHANNIAKVEADRAAQAAQS